MLRTDSLVKVYGKRTVVNGNTIAVEKGEIVGLLGPNGAGKTTSFNMIVGLVRPTQGSVYIDEKEVTKYPMFKRARMGLGYLPQENSIFRRLTVKDNILAILETLGISKKERMARLEVLLQELEISHLADSMAYTLSGGEKRRLELTRCLVTNPSYILLDEPFAGVDPIAVEDMQSVIIKLRDRGIGVLITDHNVYETLKITNKSYIIYEGKILREGSPKVLAEDEMVKKLYLGEDFVLR